MSDKDISQMDFKELRNEVQLLRDELAIMQRKYEDILYNLDEENFSGSIIKEKNGMKTQILINEEGISTLVEDLDNYSTITQTNSKIAMVVSKGVSAKFTMNKKPTRTNTSDEEKGMICEYDDTLYYYNNISKAWEECPYEGEIKSLFEQTSDGFNLVGNVSVSGKIMATDNNESYSQMSETGFDVWVDGAKKIGIGCFEGNEDYPYISLGVGVNATGRNAGCVCKLGRGIWIGDTSIIKAGGNYPGGMDNVIDIFEDYPQATGIFVDLNSGVIWQYNQGTPQHI